MDNPFELIFEKLNALELKLNEITGRQQHNSQIEIIGRFELCKRLDITEPTVIRWEKKGKIPVLRIGSCIRYDWLKVIEALKNDSE